MFSYQPVNNHQDLLNVVDSLLLEADLKREDFGGQVTFAGMDPIRPTHIKVGCASASISAANAIASAIIWKQRSGESQDIHVDLRKAYVTQSPCRRPDLTLQYEHGQDHELARQRNPAKTA